MREWDRKLYWSKWRALHGAYDLYRDCDHRRYNKFLRLYKSFTSVVSVLCNSQTHTHARTHTHTHFLTNIGYSFIHLKVKKMKVLRSPLWAIAIISLMLFSCSGGRSWCGSAARASICLTTSRGGAPWGVGLAERPSWNKTCH